MSNYWEKRAARQMHSQMQKAEDYMGEIAEYYMAASLDLQDKAKDILRRFRLKHNLSEYEAEQILANIDPSDIKGILARLEKDPKNKAIKDELTAQAAAARIRNLQSIFNQVKKTTASLADRLQRGVRSLLKKLGLSSWYHTVFDLQKQAGSGWHVKVDDKLIDNAIKRSWAGSGFSQRIWGNTDELEKAVKKEIMKNLLTGRPVEEAAKAINDQFGKGMYNARRLVRTEAAYITNQMTLEGYKSQGVEKYVYVAILDLRTSKVCRGLDKKRFLVKNATVGVNYPPMHPFCRSTTVPWVSDALLKQMRQKALDPKTGKRVTVPGDMTYDEWYKQFVQGQPTGQPAGDQTTQTVRSGTVSSTVSNGSNNTSFGNVPETKTSMFDRIGEITPELKAETEQVLKPYLEKATPGQGTKIYEPHVKDNKDPDGEHYGEVLYKDFGGNITFQTKSEDYRRADYNWNGEQWEHKSISSFNSIDKQVESGLGQIKEEKGGLVLQIKETKNGIYQPTYTEIREKALGRCERSARNYGLKKLDIFVYDGDALAFATTWKA